MKTELIEYLNKADPQDLTDCLKENYSKDSPSYFNMLSEIYHYQPTMSIGL